MGNFGTLQTVACVCVHVCARVCVCVLSARVLCVRACVHVIRVHVCVLVYPCVCFHANQFPFLSV